MDERLPTHGRGVSRHLYARHRAQRHPRDAGRLAAMIMAINPDVLAIEQAPSRAAEIELFLRDGVSIRFAPDRFRWRG
jgi:hypothetical protein